jgi:YD repeat-containing protein
MLLGLAASGLAATPAIHYVYDDLNRLVAVVDQEGNAATYTYDGVGNILAIERFEAASAPGPVAITLVWPSVGLPGTRVQIFGKGFAATPAQNRIGFTGSTAAVSAAAPNRLETTVPAGATTGPITVGTPFGTATSPMIFRVLAPLTVAPAAATLGVTRTRQFEAYEGGVPTTRVRWAVNGLPRGDAATGTISADGLYTAPATPPTPSTVTITATHRDDAAVRAAATVTIVPPQPVFLASLGVSVAVAPPRRVEQNLAAATSVQVRPPGAALVLAHAVSARRDIATAAALAPQVAVTREPVITGVNPPLVVRGSTTAVVVTGRGFQGATALEALLGLVSDPGIAVGPLTVAADGRQAMADVTVDGGAVPGARILRITTAGAGSTAAGTGANILTVQ